MSKKDLDGQTISEKGKLIRTMSRERLRLSKAKSPLFPQLDQSKRPSTAVSILFSLGGCKDESLESNINMKKSPSSVLDPEEKLIKLRAGDIQSYHTAHTDQAGGKVFRPFTASAIVDYENAKYMHRQPSKLSKSEIYSLCQEERERNRSIIYAMNSVMKVAFDKDFDIRMKGKQINNS